MPPLQVAEVSGPTQSGPQASGDSMNRVYETGSSRRHALSEHWISVLWERLSAFDADSSLDSGRNA